MKNIIQHGVLCCMLCFVVLFDQPSFAQSITLDHQINTGTYVATDLIRLQNNFKSAPDANQRFSAYIDETTDKKRNYDIQKTTNISYSGSDLPLGTTRVVSTVSATGAATCQIPIVVPQGTAGVQPTLSLVYNSQSGSGIAGVGWGLSGLSAISRVGSNLYDDNELIPIRFDSGDHYMLDGQRLVSDNVDNLYRTTINSYSRIAKIGGLDPQTFILTTKDGMKVEYGATDDSRCAFTRPLILPPLVISVENSKPYSWLVNKKIDPNGNYMTYTYQNIENQVVLSKIEYTGNESLPYCSVTFEYVTKVDKSVYYTCGWPQYNNLLLKEIKAYSNGVLVHRFDCSYKYISNASRLSLVSEYGMSNELIGNTYVDWGESKKSMSSTQISIPDAGYSWDNISEKQWQAGDVDGDGKAELISTIDSSLSCFRFINFNNILKVEIFKQQEDNSFSKISNFNVSNGWMSSNPSQAMSHYKGVGRGYDGKTKYTVASFSSDRGNSYIDFHMKDCISGGDNVYHVDLVTRLEDDPMIEPIWTLGDLNNDGIDEIVMIDSKYSTSTNYGYRTPMKIISPQVDKCAVTSSFFASTLDEKFVAGQILVADFNTDGINDIMIIHDKGFVIKPSFSSTKLSFSFTKEIKSEQFNSRYSFIRMGDFNGDGAPDFIVNETNTSNWILFLNNGRGIFIPSTVSCITMQNESFTALDDGKDNCVVTDFNNDGKSDLIVFDYTYKPDYIIGLIKDGGIFTGAHIYWYQSTGSGFTEVAKIDTEDHGYSRIKNTVAADFNGDGKDDVVNFGGYLTKTQSTDGFTFTTNFDDTFNDGFVTKISGTPRNYVEFFYQPLTISKHNSALMNDTPFYIKGTNSLYPVVDMQASLYCVRSTKQADALGLESFIDYSYREASIHPQGRGFLGFKQTNTYNYTTNKLSTYTCELDIKNYFLPHKSSLISSSISTGATVSRVDNNYVNTFERGVYTSVLPTVLELDFWGRSKTTTNEYDLNGNVNKSVIDYLDGCSITTSSENFVVVGSSSIPSRPQKITITKKHSDDEKSYSLLTNYAYDTKGNIISKSTNGVTTTYSDFTPHGVPRVVKTVAASKGGNYSQITTTLYDEYSRFPVKVMDNTSGVTTEFLYDPVTGNKLTETALGKTTRYEYDNNRGLLVKVINPRGNYVSTSYQADAATGGYTVTETPSYGQPTSTKYDAFGKVLEVATKDYAGTDLVTSSTYNSNGTLQKIEKKLGGIATSSKSYTYYDDSHGKVKTEVNNISSASTSYVYGSNWVEVTVNGKKTTTLYDSWGNPKSVTDPNNQIIVYSYFSCGKTKSISSTGYFAAMTYDALGNQTSLLDNDINPRTAATYEYDAVGRLVNQKNAAGEEIKFYYDTKGRLMKKTGPDGQEFEVYEYEQSSNGFGKVKSVENKSTGAKEEYQYDEYGQLIRHVKTIDQTINPLVFEYQYDNYGNNTKIYYPNGFVITRKFRNGRLVEVLNSNETQSYWKLTNASATLHQYVLGANMGANMQYTKQFTNTGTPDVISVRGSGGTGNEYYREDYVFDAPSGLLKSRTVGNQRESFEYNIMEQLIKTSYYKNDFSKPLKTEAVNYAPDNSGNIAQKDNVGDYGFNGNHAIQSLSNSSLNLALQNVSYNFLNQPTLVTQANGSDNYSYSFSYDPLGQRNKMVYVGWSLNRFIAYYDGLFERKIRDNDGAVYDYCYIEGDDGVVAIVQSSAGTVVNHFISKDYLGSFVFRTTVNSVSSFNKIASYNAWGMPRLASDWTTYFDITKHLNTQNVPISSVFFTQLDRRGYLGQEHLFEASLINLNARLYDPALGLFLAPDVFMARAGFNPGLNRYAYCLGNPLKYVDVDGNEPVTIALILCIVVPLLMDYGVQYSQNKDYSGLDRCWKNIDWFDVAFAGGMGAVCFFVPPLAVLAVNVVSPWATNAIDIQYEGDEYEGWHIDIVGTAGEHKDGSYIDADKTPRIYTLGSAVESALSATMYFSKAAITKDKTAFSSKIKDTHYNEVLKSNREVQMTLSEATRGKLNEFGLQAPDAAVSFGANQYNDYMKNFWYSWWRDYYNVPGLRVNAYQNETNK